MRALLLSLLLFAGCSSNQDVTVVYLEYNLQTGIAEGYVKSQGKLTAIRMEPEQLELISK